MNKKKNKIITPRLSPETLIQVHEKMKYGNKIILSHVKIIKIFYKKYCSSKKTIPLENMLTELLELNKLQPTLFLSEKIIVSMRQSFTKLSYTFFSSDTNCYVSLYRIV